MDKTSKIVKIFSSNKILFGIRLAGDAAFIPVWKSDTASSRSLFNNLSFIFID